MSTILINRIELKEMIRESLRRKMAERLLEKKVSTDAVPPVPPTKVANPTAGATVNQLETKEGK